ncbi:MAG: GatB/YqeY domain-containing protein [Sandaracinus sp.]|nr:GatB/YqeY domain-containing protein [Sandaracinus sp.]MCB9630935.1 GatB/YqeY domain-containing protein [Sandaracinus sp.]
MSVRNQLAEDLKTAMKAKDLLTRDVLRMIKSGLDEAELKKGAPLDDGEELDVLVRAVKTRQESAAQYDEGGRPELAEKERAEIGVVERYLPKAMSEAEARDAIEALAKELGLSEKKQMGQLMKAVQGKYRGVIDGKLASKIAGSLLS